jgi:F-type H+-transporting ATPase subunit delta
MEILSKPASRYAQAFADWAHRQGVLDVIREEIDQLLRLIENTPDLRRFLGNHLIPQAMRQTTLVTLFEGRVHPALLRLIYFVEFKKRLGLLPQILRSFQQKDEHLRGVVRGRVVFAQPVDPAVERQVESWVAMRIPVKELRLESRVDAALIGGLTIRVADLFWDGSVAGGLHRIRRRMESPLPAKG